MWSLLRRGLPRALTRSAAICYPQLRSLWLSHALTRWASCAGSSTLSSTIAASLHFSASLCRVQPRDRAHPFALTQQYDALLRVYTCCIICERDFDVAAALARPHGCIRSQVQNVLTCQVLQLGAVQCERAAALSAGAPTSICNLRPSIRSFQQCETGCHSELASLTLER